MPNFTKLPVSLAARSLLFLSAIGILPLAGQESGEVYNLDPFVVSTNDVGYQARNSLSATKFDIQVKSVPITVTSLTQEYLEDTYSQSLEDAVRFSAGITRADSVSAEEEDGFFIRGLKTGRAKRNGIVQLYTQDMTNVQKVEVVKGPMSLLYGQVEPGGLINYLTLNALPEFRTDLSVTVGSDNHFKSQLNHTGPILKGDEDGAGRLLYRVDASYREDDGWRDNTEDQRSFSSLLLEYKPFASTTIEIQWDRLNQNSYNAAPLPKINKAWRQIWLDLVAERDPSQYSELWTLAGQDPSDGENPTKEGSLIEQKFGPVTRVVIGGDDIGPRRWDGYADYWEWTGNLVPTNAFNDILRDLYTIEIRQQLYQEWYAKFYMVYTDMNRESVWGNLWGIGVSGELGPGYSSNHWDRYNEDLAYQLEVTGKWEIGGMENQTIIGVEYLDLEFDSYLATGTRNNLLRPSIFEEVIANPTTNPYFNATSLRPTNSGTIAFDLSLPLEPRLLELRTSKSAFISNVARFFNGRLLVLGGIRYDELETEAIRESGNQLFADDSVSPQIGASFEVNDNFTLYASYSESFVPQSGTTDDLKPDEDIAALFASVVNPDTLPGADFTVSGSQKPWLGSGYEFGAKFELLDGKLSGSMAYFHVELDGLTSKVSKRVFGLNSVGDEVFRDIGISTTDNGREVDGFEIELFARPMNGLQVVFSYSYLESNDIVTFGRPDGSQGSFPIPSVTVPENQIGVWTKYSFEEGKLEGLSIGGGFNWLDKRYGAYSLNADNPNPDVVNGGLEIEDIILLDSQLTFELLVGYSFDVYGVDTNLQLNVKNLLDERFILPGGMPNDPTQVYLSLKMSF